MFVSVSNYKWEPLILGRVVSTTVTILIYNLLGITFPVLW